MSIFSNLVFFLLMLFSMGPAIADDPSGFANSQSNSLVSNDQDSTRTETRMEEVRRKLPDLKNLDDEAFVDAVHKLYYPEIDKKEFEKLMGYSRPSKVSTNLLHTIMFWLVLIGGFLGYAYMYRNEKMNKDANLIISNEEIGIKGWLKFFIVMLGIFSPALNFGSTANSFVESELAYETLAGSQVWENYKNVVWLIIAVFSGFNIFAALQLRFKWKPMSVTFARIAVALTPIGCILVGVVAPRLFTGGQYAIDNKIVGQIIYSIVISAIWLVYLHMSNLVHATYSNSHEKKSPHANNTDMPVVTSNQHESISSINGASSYVEPPKTEQPHQVPSLAPTIRRQDDVVSDHIDKIVTEDEMYEKIGSELDSGALHVPTWLKAFSQASGDENTSKATYIKLRIERLTLEEKQKTDEKKDQQVNLALKSCNLNTISSEVIEVANSDGYKLSFENITSLKDKWQNGITLSSKEFYNLVVGLLDYDIKSAKLNNSHTLELFKLAQYRGGNTLLHDAVQMGSVELVKLLIDAGADCSMKNRIGKLPGQLTDNSDILQTFKNA